MTVLRARSRRDEQGFSLVELIISMALVTGVFAIASSIFVTGLRGDAQVHTTTQATMQAQAIAQGIERSVRNAQKMTPTSGTGSTLAVWTTLGGTRQCQKWTQTGSGGTSKIEFGQDSTMPTATTPWAGSGAIAGATLSVTPAIAGGRATVSYVVTLPSKSRPVTVSGTVRSRTPLSTAAANSSTTCGL